MARQGMGGGAGAGRALGIPGGKYYSMPETEEEAGLKSDPVFPMPVQKGSHNVHASLSNTMLMKVATMTSGCPLI